MLNWLGNIAFLNPWILAGLAALPVIWYLLRITPPPPRLIVLPTARFLAGLIPDRQTPSHTPWWLLLLRLTVAALVLFALAGPVLNPSAKLEGDGPVRIVLDNGWASAQTWDLETQAAQKIIAGAGRENRNIWLLTTAPAAGNENPFSAGPLSAAQAMANLHGLKPLPWPADYAAATRIIRENKPPKNIKTYFLSDGLDEGEFKTLANTLQAQGGLILITPPSEKLPLVLKRPDKPASGKLQVEVKAPDSTPPGRPVTLQALGANGDIIDQKNINLKPGTDAVATFDTPDLLKNEIAQIRIGGLPGAASVYSLDESYRKKTVGLIGPSEETDPKPFVEARFYIRRALEPFAMISEGTPKEILEQNPAIIIMPDVGSLPPATLDSLEKWVRGGGLLLRFAGPAMAANQGQQFLTPVRLRGGGRSLNGALTWEKPQKLIPFPANGPLNGIELHEDIFIRQQILAEPEPDMESKTWAQLEDGTPLITASPLDKGMLVMVHTTASAEWSDLPLSGVFVQILRRVTSLAGRPQNETMNIAGSLDPIWVLDGLGAVKNPDNTAEPIPSHEFAKTKPGPKHPPGLYGNAGFQVALNLGDHIRRLDTPEKIPGVTLQNYGRNHERDLMPVLLYGALSLLLIDWLIMIVMSRGAKPLMRAGGMAMIMLLAMPGVSHAQNNDDLKYADGLYLAYIQSGDPALDALSQKGLENLAAILNRRTSVEPDGVVGLKPETDTLAFFPFIYWPVSRTQPELSDTALTNVQNYLDHGGTILFDTRDGSAAGNGMNADSATLQRLIGRLNIPALEPLPKNHVLLRSFYLLSDLPGRLDGGTLWVETQSLQGRDGVSSVILGSNDWAGAWAEGDAASMLSGSTRQQELSLRFGVNVTIYALTGNYKADQVHVRNILERLGQ